MSSVSFALFLEDEDKKKQQMIFINWVDTENGMVLWFVWWSKFLNNWMTFVSGKRNGVKSFT